MNTDRSDVLVGIATIPERETSLRKTIGGLAPQAGKIVVSLNDYRKVPAFLAKYKNVVPVLRRSGNSGDSEKFAAVDDWEGYVATCDDDLDYPRDYISTLVEGIDKYGQGAAVGFHGGKTLGWNGSAIAASHRSIQCLGSLAEDDLDVNVLGTGVLGYHTSHVPVWRDVFRHANMADVQLACHARLHGIPFVALAHERRWIRDICPPLTKSPRIHWSNKSADGSVRDTRLLREQELRRFDWLSDPPKRPHIRVTVSTCQRPEKLLELLADLDRESQWADLEVFVYEDPSTADYTEAREFCQKRQWKWDRQQSHLGRYLYWKMVSKQLEDAKKSSTEWFLFLPDDVRLLRHAIPRAITNWSLLEDPATLTLWRLNSLEHRSNWTGMKPVAHDHATEIFHVDGLYLCKRPTLESLGWRCGNVSRRRTSTGSSVGSWISRELHAKGKRMYRVDRSLVSSNDGGVSIMNPQERIKHPTVCL